jgi:hypothetical protein
VLLVETFYGAAFFCEKVRIVAYSSRTDIVEKRLGGVIRAGEDHAFCILLGLCSMFQNLML